VGTRALVDQRDMGPDLYSPPFERTVAKWGARTTGTYWLAPFFSSRIGHPPSLQRGHNQSRMRGEGAQKRAKYVDGACALRPVATVVIETPPSPSRPIRHACDPRVASSMG
jgi:hypothetical protein